ncbi:MAG: hypothetical protein HY318_09970 [Armatimonadetes bacterium]|nr:hypothetical protein [Armatimonadota bacterium]
MKKEEAKQHWQSLPDRLDPSQCMEPIPYKHTGSRYGACGIRIDGTPEFIDAVLSNLKDLLRLENNTTRLELNYTEAKDRETGEFLGYVCYIRCHERGRERQAGEPAPPALGETPEETAESA